MAKAQVDKNSPQYLTSKVASARYSLLLILIFTAVNLVMLLLDSGYYFLFSASVPYYLTGICFVFDGGSLGTFTVIALVLSLVILGAYLLCWLLSKKKTGWFIVALVMFIVDTLGLIGFCVLAEDFSGIVDFVFHAWVIWSLVGGISAGSKLKQLAAAEAQSQYYTPVQPPVNGPEF